MAKPERKQDAQPAQGRTGTCRVYGPAGEILWEQTGFTVGTDRIPRHLSMPMVAMQVGDTTPGARIAVWNPWHVLP